MFELGVGTTLVVGDNGVGKTNFLEALLVLCEGSSYRNKDVSLLAHDADWARVDGVVDSVTRSVKFQKLEAEKIQKTYEVDNKPYVRMVFQHRIPVVLFEPNQSMLLQGDPDGRRNFLDDLLEKTDPHYPAIRKHYRRVLSQRNSLLKTGRGDTGQLFVWNIRLSELAGYIVKKRTELVDTIQEYITEVYCNISGSSNTIKIQYYSKIPTTSYETHLIKKLEDSLELDKIRGYTTYGPHRDDFFIYIDNQHVSDSASRGELRTALLSLKVIEARIVEEARNQKPLLLLDDVFGELDSVRRRTMARFLSNYQTIITTTDIDNDNTKSSLVIKIPRH
jgi:DNA replication and repair protein RecF